MLEPLREALGGVPVLADMLKTALADSAGEAANTEALRARLESLQRDLARNLAAEKRLYAVVHFPEHAETCPRCGETIAGHHRELNNAVTGKGMIVSSQLFHAFVAHGEPQRVEALTGLSGQRLGETTLAWDWGALKAVVAGAELPPAAARALEEASLTA